MLQQFDLTGRRLLAVLVWLCISLTMSPMLVSAQDSPPKDGRYFEALARNAYQQKDYASFLDNMKMAAELRPNHPRLMYNLAIGYALNGLSNEALLWLGKTAAMGLIVPAARDEDFNSIKDLAEFKAVLQRIEKNKAPIISSLPGFTIHEKGLVPESVAYDPAGKLFYISSVYKRKILSLNQKGETKDFATERDGLWSVMGMRVDARRRLLWVCTAAHPQMMNYSAEENGSSGLFKYDLRTGKLLKKYLLLSKPKPHWLGDLVINSAGDVFASDSITPAIYVVRQRSDQLELLLEGEPFTSPQGLAFTADEKSLFMADYAKGIFLIDLNTRKVTNLSPALNSTLLGIDGLYYYQGTLIGVQNGVNPPRLIRLFLGSDLSRIEQFETIEANNPVFDEPTLGVLVRDTFYFVANSQWGAIDQKGQLAPAEKLKDPTVLKIKLSTIRRTRIEHRRSGSLATSLSLN
jgi:hypothetical protein